MSIMDGVEGTSTLFSALSSDLFISMTSMPSSELEVDAPPVVVVVIWTLSLLPVEAVMMCW